MKIMDNWVDFYQNLNIYNGIFLMAVGLISVISLILNVVICATVSSLKPTRPLSPRSPRIYPRTLEDLEENNKLFMMTEHGKMAAAAASAASVNGYVLIPVLPGQTSVQCPIYSSSDMHDPNPRMYPKID